MDSAGGNILVFADSLAAELSAAAVDIAPRIPTLVLPEGDKDVLILLFVGGGTCCGGTCSTSVCWTMATAFADSPMLSTAEEESPGSAATATPSAPREVDNGLSLLGLPFTSSLEAVLGTI